MANAPIALFAYKRADKLEKCIKALEKNQGVEETNLYIFADGAKGEQDREQVAEVRNYITRYKGQSKFRTVTIEEKNRNIGLANSIIAGVTSVIEKYGKIIVVEDDLITTPDFIEYMNGALDYYEDKKRYGSISGYTYPLKELENYNRDVYVIKKGECWGWGTWKDRWLNVDWEVKDFKQYRYNPFKRREFKKLEYGLDRMLVNQMCGKIDSWAVRWCYHLFKMGQLTVYPKESKTMNIGFDNSGTHCNNKNEIYQRNIIRQHHSAKYEDLEVDSVLAHAVSIYEKDSLKQRISNVLKKYFGKEIND